MKISPLTICNEIIKNVKPLSILRKKYFLNYCIKKKYLFNKNFDSFAVLEKFNLLIGTQINNINLIEILRELLVEDLKYDFCAICSINENYNILEINFVGPDNYLKDYVLPLENLDKSLKLFNLHSPFILNKQCIKELDFNNTQKALQVVCLPISLDGSSKTILCIASGNLINLQNPLLNLIAQQTNVVLANIKLNNELKCSQNLDPVTSLSNHNYFQQILNFELRRAEILGRSLSLIIMEPITFMNVDKTYRTLIYDQAIYELSKILTEKLENNFSISRLSNTKIGIVAPNTNYNNAKIYLKKLQKEISKSKILRDNDTFIGIGVSNFKEGAKNKEELLNNADDTLTIAKNIIEKKLKSYYVIDKNLSISDKNTLNNLSTNVNVVRKSNITDELIYHLHNVDENDYNSTILIEIISSLAAAIDAKDSYTRGHSQAVSRYAEMLCQEIGLNSDQTERIRIGALMHDIGKIGVPERVLAKPSKLNTDEWELVKQHPTIGARRIIQPITALADLIPIVEHHHERWDGQGYPSGLKGKDIPLGARIVSIVDAFNTMTTDRPYRKALNIEDAQKILQKGSGQQWDSYLIRSFLRISKKAYNIIQN